MKQREKKAVSPIIATIILVALVIALSVVVWAFISSFMREAVVKTIAGEDHTAESVCAESVSIAVTLGNLKQGEIFVENEGSVPLAGFNLELRKKGQAKKSFFSCGIDIGQSSLEICETFAMQEFGSLTENCEEAIVTPVLLGTGQNSGNKKLSPCESKTIVKSC